MATKKGKAFRVNFAERFPHLPQAPVVEAVIQWIARAGTPFPSEEAHRQLADLLPDYPTCQKQQEMQIGAQFGLDTPATEAGRDVRPGFRLTSQDSRRVAQFTRDGLIFSRMAPYQKWEVLQEEAIRLWKTYQQLADPSEIQRLGVRFINRIPLIDPADVGKYLATPPKSLEPLGLPRISFFDQSLHSVPDEPLLINAQTVLQPLPNAGLIVDIDVSATQPFSPEDRTVLDYLCKMRWLKNKAFFSLMSKGAIASFKKRAK